jgi:prophage DNA circulation protein
MSWKDNLLDASFRGLVFDCLQTEDEAERDTASHAYPYIDGEDVEDLGRKARQLRLTAVFLVKTTTVACRLSGGSG